MFNRVLVPFLRPAILRTVPRAFAINPAQVRYFASSDRTFDTPPINPDIDLNDVGGNQSVIQSLIDIVRYITSPTDYSAAGIKPPKGVIISGKPGTGKTLLAHAIAGHTGVPLLEVSCASMIGEYMGQGERLLRESFEKARAIAPCILCFNEMDAIGLERFSPPKQACEQAVNTGVAQLLTELEAA